MNWFAAAMALVPPAVVTRTLTVPAVPAGAVAVIEVALLTVKLVAAVTPKVTPVAPVKSVPVSVTTVPPAVLPELGVTAVTVGAAAPEPQLTLKNDTVVPGVARSKVKAVPAAKKRNAVSAPVNV